MRVTTLFKEINRLAMTCPATQVPLLLGRIEAARIIVLSRAERSAQWLTSAGHEGVARRGRPGRPPAGVRRRRTGRLASSATRAWSVPRSTGLKKAAGRGGVRRWKRRAGK